MRLHTARVQHRRPLITHWQGSWKLLATGVGFSAQWSGPMYPKAPPCCMRFSMAWPGAYHCAHAGACYRTAASGVFGAEAVPLRRGEGSQRAQRCSRAEYGCGEGRCTSACDEMLDVCVHDWQAMSARLAELMKGVFEGKGNNVTEAQVCAATAKSGGYLTPGDWTPGD